MKTPHNLYGKKLPSSLILLLLTFGTLNVLNVNIIGVSAGTYPSIYIEPSSIENEALTAGENFTVSIKTDYTGNDVWSYQFNLSYNPAVLEGVQAELANGDIITTAVSPFAIFVPGEFNNNTGELSLTYAYFYYQRGVPPFWPAAVASGPGTLANVTFKVVGKGSSNITLGSKTKLLGFTEGGYGDVYTIIDAEYHPDHIQHGYFDNLFQHDVAVGSVTAPDKAAVGELVPISVEVANIGKSAEVANVTIHHDSTLIGFNDTVVLPANSSTIVPFDWSTSGLAQGTHTINATATIPGDGDPTDNWNTTTVLLSLHNVRVPSVTAPDKAAVGELVPISVEVANIGASEEEVNVTIRHDTTYIDSQNVTLAQEESETVSFSWDTTDVTKGTHTINATATIPGDLDPTDNWKNTTILLVMHDVAVIDLEAPTSAHLGDTVPINVTVRNQGSFTETLNVRVSYDGNLIGFNDTVVLPAQNSKIVPFSWNTTGVVQGDYTINATATIPLDDDPTDNSKTVKITLKAHDIKVISVTPSPYSVFVGELINIRVDVKNFGDYNETFKMKVSYNTSIITEFQQIKLPPKNSTILTYDWNTTDVALGSYKIKAEAILAEGVKDAKPDDNLKTHDVYVNPPLGTIAGIVKDSSTGDPIAGATVTANGMSATTNSSGAYTISDVPAGTYTVTASATGYEDSSQTSITVVAGQPTTVDFELTPTEPEQPLNILLYAGAAAAAIIVIAAIAVYVLKIRKPT